MIISHFLKLFQPSVDFCSARMYFCCYLFILSRSFLCKLDGCQVFVTSYLSQFLTLFLFFLFVFAADTSHNMRDLNIKYKIPGSREKQQKKQT